MRKDLLAAIIGATVLVPSCARGSEAAPSERSPRPTDEELVANIEAPSTRIEAAATLSFFSGRPAARAWLEPGFITTDYVDAAFSIWVHWGGHLEPWERDSVQRLYLFDATGRPVEIGPPLVEGSSLDDATGLAAVHFAPTARLQRGWYAIGARLRGRLASDVGGAGDADSFRDVFSYIHVGSAPVVAQARFCRGRGTDEVYVDFSERMSSAGLYSRVHVGASDGSRCTSSEDEGETSVATVRFNCTGEESDTRELVIHVDDGVFGAAGVRLATESMGDTVLDAGVLRGAPETGCIAIPARLSQAVVTPDLSSVVD